MDARPADGPRLTVSVTPPLQKTRRGRSLEAPVHLRRRAKPCVPGTTEQRERSEAALLPLASLSFYYWLTTTVQPRPANGTVLSVSAIV